ncbi:hypothetical protein [Zunongwangia endophytica]|uniref:Uncharacterized protein n=1 Tax=Zunongwangia endophytica TaxID=1808945 RepID=A0ABV8HDX7_9FLAO|nr:hypothetical protein [Zunongwangia endophytica]MDN3596660.1 hypothetical protein [Zunongwangia endophytica]
MILVKPVFPVVDYVLNYDYIAKELCENKERPELACNGKCYLMQALAEASEEESEQKKESSIKKVDIPLFYTEKVVLINNNQETEAVAHNFRFQPQFYHFQNSQEFFHPPIV